MTIRKWGIAVKINVFHYIEGAKKARGAAVIIDVFRAFSFECYLIQNNVYKIIPVASKELAYSLRDRNPDWLLAGERRGVTLPGFDYGNSPSQIEKIDFSGKTVVHTTSAGTQGLEKARGADEILTGSFVNARAVTEYIKKRGYDEVSLVCMGEDGVRPAEEDDLCAHYIRTLLEGNEPDMTAAFESLKSSGGKKFFNRENEVFPERDYALCVNLNRFGFALRFDYDSEGLGFITKLEV